MYNIPILTPEDEARQPINTSDGRPATYKAPINTNIDDPNPKYWIKLAKKECCESGKLYNIYRGPFSNKEEKIMTLSTRISNNLRSARDKSVSGHEEISHAELLYKGPGGGEANGWYTLRNQQEELGLITLSADEVTYDSFFKLTKKGYPYSTLMVIFCLSVNAFFGGLFVLCAMISGPEQEGKGVITVMSIIGVATFLILFFYFCFSQCCKKNLVNRLHTSDVEDIRTGRVVAKVYKLRGICLTHRNDLEIICHEKLSIPQLMGLFSLAILTLTQKFTGEKCDRESCHSSGDFYDSNWEHQQRVED